MKQLIEQALDKVKRMKAGSYAYSDDEKDKIVLEFKKQKAETKKKKALEKGIKEEVEEEQEGAEVKGVEIQRYKGLGEMNAIQLWETTMDPSTRTLKQVAIADVAEADRIFDILMGDEVMPRKKFIQTHAKAVKNLDI